MWWKQVACCNGVCKACSARGPIAVGGPDEPRVGKRGPFGILVRSNLATPLMAP